MATKTLACIMASEREGARAMRHRTYSRSALETRVDYVEGKLDEAIKDLKEAIKDNKEALDKVVAKAESSRRWAIGTVITIAVAVIGFLIAAIGFLLNAVGSINL